MIKEEVVWGFKNKENALSLASNVLCKEGYEVFVQHITTGDFSSGVLEQITVAYLVVERKVEE